MIQLFRNAFASIAALNVLVLVFGHFGAWHPAADSVAAFRLYSIGLLAGLACLGLVLRGGTLIGWSVAGVVIGLFSVGPNVMPAVSAKGDPDIVLFSQNLRYTNGTSERTAAAVLAAKADLVTFQEVSQTTRQAFEDLLPHYATAIRCPFGSVGDVVILSHYPQVGTPECGRGQGYLFATLQSDLGNITLVSVHMPWPWPYGQAAQVEKLIARLQDRSGRLILAGDFNMAPWGSAVRRIAAHSGTYVTQGLRLTFSRGNLLHLPLDHVLVDTSLQAETRMLEGFGSDHRALLTSIQSFD